MSLTVPGAHNAVNAAGALTAAALAGADPADAAAALARLPRAPGGGSSCSGETSAGVPVYDEYAHHPTEVAAAIGAARTLAPARLVAVFQPHLYSRTRALAQEMGTALAAADVAVVLAVYPARERAEDFPGVDGRIVAVAAADAARAARSHGSRASTTPGGSSTATLRAGDLCLVMGAGDIDALGRSLVAL